MPFEEQQIWRETGNLMRGAYDSGRILSIAVCFRTGARETAGRHHVGGIHPPHAESPGPLLRGKDGGYGKRARLQRYIAGSTFYQRALLFIENEIEKKN